MKRFTRIQISSFKNVLKSPTVIAVEGGGKGRRKVKGEGRERRIT